MGVFFLLLIFPMIIQHIRIRGYSITYEKKNKVAISFFFVWLTVLVMFRHNRIGNDTENYIDIFNSISNMDWNQIKYANYEIGFVIFNKIISLFSNNPQILIALAAISISCMIYPTYKRLCVDASLTIVLYTMMSTFVMMFSGIRQMLAIGIGFLAYECVHKKKVVYYIFCVIIAMSFHKSAFMLAFMYPLYYAKITKKWMIAIIPTFICIFIYNKQIFSTLGLILIRFTEYDTRIEQTGAFTMLVLFVIFALFVFIIPEEDILNEEIVGLRNFLLMSIVLQMFAPLHFIAMRMNYYYIIFIPLLIPQIIEVRSKRWRQVAIIGRHAMVVFFLMYFFYNAYTSDGNLNVFPYYFFWEEI